MNKPISRSRAGSLTCAFIILMITAVRGPLARAEGPLPDPRAPYVLSNESAALLRDLPETYIQHKPKPETVPPALVERARLLQQRVLTVTEETRRANAPGPDGIWRQVKWGGLPNGWGDAVVESFRANLIINWKNLTEASDQLRFWWTLLSEFSHNDKNAGFDLISLKLSGAVFDYWIPAEPEACLKLIGETETTLRLASAPKLSSRWSLYTSQYTQALSRIAQSLPKERRDALVAEVSLRIHQSWEAEDVPLTIRTRSVATSINELYAADKIDEASSLILLWEKRHPTALEDEFWLAQRYFVASIGLGDSRKAADTFRLIENLVSTGKIDAHGQLFTVVSQSYYQSLPDPLLLHQRKAQQIRSTFPRSALNTSKP